MNANPTDHDELADSLSYMLGERAGLDVPRPYEATTLMRKAVTRRRQRVAAGAAAVVALTVAGTLVFGEVGLGRSSTPVPAGSSSGQVRSTSSAGTTAVAPSSTTSGPATETAAQVRASLMRSAQGLPTEPFTPMGGVAYHKDSAGRVVVEGKGSATTLPVPMTVRFTDEGSDLVGGDSPRVSFVVGRVGGSGSGAAHDEVWALRNLVPTRLATAQVVHDLVSDDTHAVWLSTTDGATTLSVHDIASGQTRTSATLDLRTPSVVTLSSTEVVLAEDMGTRENRATSRMTTVKAATAAQGSGLRVFDLGTLTLTADVGEAVVAATPANGGSTGLPANVVFTSGAAGVCAFVVEGARVATEALVCGDDIDSSLAADGSAALLNVYAPSGTVTPLLVSLPSEFPHDRAALPVSTLVAPLVWENDLSVVTSLGDPADPGRGLRFTLGKDAATSVVTGLPATPRR